MKDKIRKMRCQFCIKELVFGYVNPDKDYKLCDTCAFSNTGHPYYLMNNKGDSMLENPSFSDLIDLICSFCDDPENIDTENIYIEGDNLDALKLLQETYLGKVKMIYIDPPYNTGSDSFVYDDDRFISSEEFADVSGQYDENGNMLFDIRENNESNGKFHTDWLNMLYPRLRIAKDLLSEDGVIFISIDDNEQENLKKICDEIFGKRNFISNLIWKSKSGGANDSKFFAVDHEYILVYAKDSDQFSLNKDTEATVTTSYNRRDEKGEYALDRLDKQSIRYSPTLDYEIIGPNGESYYPKHKDPSHPNATWRWSKKNVEEHYNELVFENGCVYTKNYKKSGAIARSLLLEDRFGRTRTGKTDCSALFQRDLFSNPKPIKLIRWLQIVASEKAQAVQRQLMQSCNSTQKMTESVNLL